MESQLCVIAWRVHGVNPFQNSNQELSQMESQLCVIAWKFMVLLSPIKS
jgi:hypothetical protein